MERTLPTAEQLTETLTHACSIADRFAGDWAVVFYDSTYPAGRNPDRPTRVHPRPSAENPDHVPGDRDDAGIGNHAGKEACARAAALVADAYRLAGRAAAALAGIDASNELRSRPARDGQALRTQAMRTVARFRWLMGHDITRAAVDAQTVAHSAAVALIEAHAVVRGVMRDYDAVGEPTLDGRCWNCQRPAVYVKTQECDACSRYRRRTEAQIRAGKIPARRHRPVTRYAEAYDAARRRRERLRPGQLDVEGPLPGGNFRDGEWEPARPLPDFKPRREAS
jgi:hypothetical protein